MKAIHVLREIQKRKTGSSTEFEESVHKSQQSVEIEPKSNSEQS